jgi:hypothetical protein
VTHPQQRLSLWVNAGLAALPPVDPATDRSVIELDYAAG